MKPHPRALHLLLVALALPLAGCGEDTADAEPAATAEDTREERERKARTLFARARVATVPNKIDYLRTLVGHYPESEVAPHAHLELVMYLIDRAIDRPDEAWEAARTFAARHPLAPRVSEAYRMLAYRFKDDPERSGKVLAEWGAFLEKARASGELPPGQKGTFWLDGAYVAAWQGRKGDALDLLTRAIDIELEDQRIQLEIAFRLGSLQAEMGDKTAARKSFQRALELARAGAKGHREDAILAELEKL